MIICFDMLLFYIFSLVKHNNNTHQENYLKKFSFEKHTIPEYHYYLFFIHGMMAMKIKQAVYTTSMSISVIIGKLVSVYS